MAEDKPNLSTHKKDAQQSLDFQKRRQLAKDEINLLDREVVHNLPERKDFFNTVYAGANGDAARVPWADMEPKEKLIQWLEARKGINIKSTSSNAAKAIDIACGLGDNAEAISRAGYKTTGFDISHDAIGWAKKRFPQSRVDYRQADLFNLPLQWRASFNLIHECYTLQALPEQMLDELAGAIACLAAPGADLLVYTRWRQNDTSVEGPPWPLEEKKLDCFAKFGFIKISEERFETTRNDGSPVPHSFFHWQKQ